MSDRDLSPFFAPMSIAVVGAGERATSSGGAIRQMLRQAGYGGRVVPVNPKGGTIFGYEMAEAAGLLARYPRLRDGTRSDNLSDVRFHDRRGA